MLRAANIRKIRSGVWYPVAVSLLKRASFYDFEIYDSLWIYVWRVHGLNSDGVDYIIMTMWLLESVVRLKKKQNEKNSVRISLVPLAPDAFHAWPCHVTYIYRNDFSHIQFVMIRHYNT